MAESAYVLEPAIQTSEVVTDDLNNIGKGRGTSKRGYS
jgi:hypothetical protein